MAALEWILSMQEGLNLLEQYPNDVFRVDYELLCDSPREKMREIAEFMQLDLNDEKFYRYAEMTLRQNKPKPEFELDPIIKDTFMSTMHKLGY
jgi:hypothetical protein